MIRVVFLAAIAAGAMAAGCAKGEGETDVSVETDGPGDPDFDGREEEPGEGPEDDAGEPDTPDLPDEADSEIPATCGDGRVDPGEQCDGGEEACVTPCGTNGTRVCSAACFWEPCMPPAETCNGEDDDCDGEPDEDFECAEGRTTACASRCGSTGTGLCASGCHVPPPLDCDPPAETCNGEDDDCDLGCDEGFGCCAGETQSCITAGGLAGTRTCTAACAWDDCEPPCPAECSVVPGAGEIGASCVSDAGCGTGGSCLVEAVESFMGESYVDNPGGMCVAYGTGTSVCDPADPLSCPSGATCIYMGTSMGVDFNGCWDACVPADASGDPYSYNCGCREGYACDLVGGFCTGGCSNDRQCCERWWDLDGDWTREASEVAVKAGCSNVCDDTPPGPCRAAWQCINNGDPSNVWSGPCEGDAWCPPDGRCLDPFNYADDSGIPFFPGGLCIKDACDLVGRGCSDHAGGCANLGTSADPFWACVGACHFGRSLSDPAYECRTTAGQEHACNPVDDAFWSSPPADGSDGFCWPGNFAGGTAPLGAACTDDAACASPLGIGVCMGFEGIAASSFCSASCTRDAAEAHAVCGGDDGTGTASGVCFSGICWEACPSPGGALGANGCTLSSMACYATSILGAVYGDAASAMPAGACVPACTDNAWCRSFWGLPMVCNASTGVCG
jgi:hypothetical protein